MAELWRCPLAETVVPVSEDGQSQFTQEMHVFPVYILTIFSSYLFNTRA